MVAKNNFKERLLQTEEELDNTIDLKLKFLAEYAAKHIKRHWRLTGHDPQFTEQTANEKLYVVRFLEDLPEEEFCENLMKSFQKWNVEFFNTGGWISTIVVDVPDPSDPRTGASPHGVHGAFLIKDKNRGDKLSFNSKEDHQNWLKHQQKSQAIFQAIKDSGVSYD